MLLGVNNAATGGAILMGIVVGIVFLGVCGLIGYLAIRIFRVLNKVDKK